MPDAHTAAVEAMADELWRQRTQHSPDATRPAGWFVQQAKDLLAALTTSAAVREALVEPMFEALVEYSSRQKRYKRDDLCPPLVDAILAALEPNDHTEGAT